MKIFVPTVAECKLVTIYASCIGEFQKHNFKETHSWVLEPKTADLIVLFEEWGTRFWQYADTLLDDPLVRDHWERIYTINCDDLGRGFLPGCYTSLNRANFEPELHRSCAYPYVYNELVKCASSQKRSGQKWLFSFRGTDRSHPIRRKLFHCFSREPSGKMVRTTTNFHSHSHGEKRDYIEDILESKFVLCPRGWSPTTYRLFEVMELGRCPVIISDDWIPIGGVPWSECSIIIREKDVARCVDILRDQEPNAERLGEAARNVWEAHFSEANKFNRMLESILELQSQGRDDGGDYRNRWSSWRFYYRNEWLPHQRAASNIARRLGPVRNVLPKGRLGF
jgi:Exostosin family